jgi:hypothetical protein
MSNHSQGNELTSAAESPSTSPKEGELVTIVARTPGGEAFTSELALASNVEELKELIAEKCGVASYRLTLVLGESILENKVSLGDVGLTGKEDAELLLVIGPAMPEWAHELGFTNDHPGMLRSYFEKHEIESPVATLSDEEVWDLLAKEHSRRRDIADKLSHWSHLVTMSRDGIPSCTLRATPGELLDVKFSGFIHNKNGDTCIHQLLLGLDTSPAAELYDGVPRRGHKIDVQKQIKAPQDPGTYMLWRKTFLEYSMHDARTRFLNGGNIISDARYPNDFVGWLVVQP